MRVSPKHKDDVHSGFSHRTIRPCYSTSTDLLTRWHEKSHWFTQLSITHSLSEVMPSVRSVPSVHAAHQHWLNMPAVHCQQLAPGCDIIFMLLFAGASRAYFLLTANDRSTGCHHTPPAWGERCKLESYNTYYTIPTSTYTFYKFLVYKDCPHRHTPHPLPTGHPLPPRCLLIRCRAAPSAQDWLARAAPVWWCRYGDRRWGGRGCVLRRWDCWDWLPCGAAVEPGPDPVGLQPGARSYDHYTAPRGPEGKCRVRPL